MNRKIYLYTLEPNAASMDGAEDHLMLSYIAVECLFGRESLQEEAYFWLDRAKGLVAIDADNGVNQYAASVFSGMLDYMISPEGYEVREALEPYRFDGNGNALKPSEKAPPQVIEVDREHPWLHPLSSYHPDFLENNNKCPDAMRDPEGRSVSVLPSFSPLDGSRWYEIRSNNKSCNATKMPQKKGKPGRHQPKRR